MRSIGVIFLLFCSFEIFGQVPTWGLQAYYAFDNDASDKGGNGNHGKVSGGVTIAADRFGNACGAMQFNGVDGYIQVPASVSMQSIKSSITAAAWFKIDKTDGVNESRFILLSQQAADGKPAYCIQLVQQFSQATSTISLSTNLKGEDKTYQTHRIENGQWYFFAITYDDGWLQTYLNGKLIWQTLNNKPVAMNDAPLEIGRDMGSATKYFKGCLDDLRIYNRGLSAADITTLYNDVSGKSSAGNWALQMPKDITQSTDKGKCSAVVSYTEPVASGGCGKAELKRTEGLSSGSIFIFGTNTVTYDAEMAGVKKSGSFNVVVKDNEEPAITCPENITVNSRDPKGKVVEYTMVSATDNCPGVKTSLVSGLASGSVFPPGMTNIKYVATDLAGNKTECSFYVRVAEDLTPEITCPGDVVAYAQLGKSDAPVVYKEPFFQIKSIRTNMTLKSGLPTGSRFKVGKNEVVYTGKDAEGKEILCRFDVIVKDTLKPVISCKGDITVKCTEGQTSAIVNYTPPMAADGGEVIPVELVSGKKSGESFPLGTTKVKYIASDASGNQSECSFNVIITEDIKPVMKCPATITVYAGADETTVIVNYDEPYITMKGEKMAMTLASGPASGGRFKVGVTPVKYTVRTTTGEDVACTFNVNVKDTGSPVITCNADINATCSAGRRGVIVNYPEPRATDAGLALPGRFVSGLKSGAEFPVGTTTVVYEATDASGNRSTCSFNVIVTENVPAAVQCPKNITVFTSSEETDALVNYDEPYATVKGEKVAMTLVEGQASGKRFKAGTTRIKYAGRTPAGEDVACVFNVIVKDTIKPTVICNSDIRAKCGSGKKTAMVSYPEPYANDAGLALPARLVSGLKSGSEFPIGTTEVKYEATDASGNQNICTFKVIVSDEVRVNVYCPDNIVAYARPESKEAAVNYKEPYADVAGNKLPMTLVSGDKPGEEFSVGETEVTYRLNATGDIKEQTCSFKITVKDTSKPVMICGSNMNITAEEGQTSVIVNYPAPTATDGGASVPVRQVSGLKSGASFPIGTAEIKYEAADASGNRAVCSFKITITAPAQKQQPTPQQPPQAQQKQEPPKPKVEEPVKPAEVKPADVKPAQAFVGSVCQPEVVKVSDPGKCGTMVNYNAPKFSGQGIKINQTQGLASGKFFPGGTTVNTFSATDAAGRNQKCSFNVTVQDNEKPVMSCPSDSVIMLSQNRKGVIFHYKTPLATDNCKADSVTLLTGSKDGCFLPLGVHPFFFEAKDAAGNSTQCGFTVTVKADEKEEVVDLPKQLAKSLQMGSDTIHYEHNLEVENCLLTVFIYDDGEEDGDSVSIVFNGQVLLDRDVILLKEHGAVKRQIVLLGGSQNYIVAKAWNTGKFGLNTLRIDIYEGYIENEKKELKNKKPIVSKIMHSRPGDASGITLKCKW